MFQLSPKEIVLVQDQLTPFVDTKSLNRALRLTGLNPENFAGGLEDRLTDAIAYTSTRVLVADFLDNLAEGKPGAKEKIGEILLESKRVGPDPHQFSMRVGGKLADGTIGKALEAKVGNNADKLALAQLMERVSGIGSRICRIETNYAAIGTGFLVGRDSVLTAYHVWTQTLEALDVEGASIESVRCRFDFLRFDGGVRIELAEPRLLAHSPDAPGDGVPGGRAAQPGELDFALLQLARPEGTIRGWYDLGKAAEPPGMGGTVWVIGHGNGVPAEASIGKMLQQYNTGDLRMHHDAWTEPGNSGSPVFNEWYLPTGLHHATDPNILKSMPAAYNQGIPLSLIHADIQNQLSSV